MQFDRAGKMLQSWTEETFHVKSSHGMRVGPDGNIWCVDVDGHVVFKLSPEGRVLMVLGNRQTVQGNNDAEDAFNRPTNVAFRANGNFYVSDGYVNSRVIEFNPAGEFVRKWGTKGTGEGQFNLVHDVQVDTQGRVYVADRLTSASRSSPRTASSCGNGTASALRGASTTSPRNRPSTCATASTTAS